MQRKRILSTLVVVMMILSMIPTFAFATTGITVTAASTEIYQGTTTAKVEVKVSDNPGIAYLSFKVGYDSEKMSLASVETSSDVFASADFIAGDTSSNPYSVLAANYTKNTTNNGNIITLNFNVDANCPAGTYDISLSTAEAYTIDEQTVDVNLTNGSIKVSQKPITGVTFADKEYTYDGTEKQIVVSGNLPSGATVDYANNKGTDANEYNATAIVRANGYADLTLNATMTIKPKTLTVTGLSASNKTYDGTTAATVNGGALAGKITDDDVNATFPTTGTFANANVGNNVAVSIADITLTGNDKSNYTLTQPTGLKANIAKAPISVKANDVTIIQGAAIPTLTYTITSGKLFGSDEITGAPTTAATGTSLGKFDITKGSLAVSSNYDLTFVKGTLTVVDKTPQNIVVSDITEKTYSDSSFVVSVTPDSTSQLNEFTFESSNTDVAEIAADGTVTIKAAGETDITVKQAGNSTYAPFVKTQKLVVKKVAIAITADDKMKKVGAVDPELTYQVTGNLVLDDSITGNLARTPGEEIGQYDILIGTLAINKNYDITFNKAVFEIVDKTPQNITVSDIGTKTYGEGTFVVAVTPDETSQLNVFTYESSNTDVAEIAADGTVTIKAAGETNITVKQAGNEEYAAAEKTVKLVVNPITVTVTGIDMENKTATFTGVLEADLSDVVLDFDKIKTTVISTGKSTVEETTTVTSTVKLSNFKLKGEKAKNYIAADTTIETTVSSTTVSENLANDENVTIEAAPVDENTIIVTDVNVAVVPEDKKISIDVTAIADTKVNTVAIPKTTVDNIIGIDAEATLEITLKDGSDENNTSTITFNAEALASIQTASGTATTLSISVNKAVNEDLEAAQITAVEEVSTKTPVVYSLSVVDEAGNSVAASFGTTGVATVKLPYVKPAGRGNIIVKYLDDFGVQTNVANPSYDDTNKIVTVKLGHFSEYLIYTEPVVSHSSGGGGVSSYTVKFDTSGGSEIKTVKVSRNKTVAEPTAPTKEGYTFDGWYTDKNLTTVYDFDTKVTKSFTLYAKWVENKTEEKPDETDKPETPDTQAMPFTDVDTNDWYYETVKTAYEKGLMNGVSDTEFGADTNVTRGMFVTVLYRMENEPATPKLNFTDVESGAYYTDAIAWANANNIVAGITDTKFAPNDNITREQMATILFRYATYKGMDTVTLAENLGQFTDNAEISEYAISALNWAVGSNVMSGKGNGILDPKGFATRAEAAAVLVRMAK